MGNKVMVLFVMLVVCGIVSAWEIEDVNGTYLDSEEYLTSSKILEWKFSWGTGLCLPETSIEFDLREKEVRMPGFGLYIIDTVFKEADGSIGLRLFYVGDEDKEDPIQLTVQFLDYNKAYITSDRWERYSEKRYSPEAKWVWYRLSGPKGN